MGKKIAYELYNPHLTISENAQKLGCSESALRKHIQANDIDRKFDVHYVFWRRIQDFYEQNPTASLREASKNLGYSINTVRKYKNLSEEELNVSKNDTNKVSTFDIKNKNAIKSVSYRQSEILAWIMKLYNEGNPFDCDLTASKCVFWKTLQKPKFLFDVNPQVEGVRNLSEIDNFEDGSFNSIVYDLPYIVAPYAKGKMMIRFSYFDSIDELYKVNDDMLERSHRLLKENGILIVKTMDTSYGGKQIWISDYVLRKAAELNFELLDKFILLTKHRIFSPSHAQRFSRKYHSYFFVFRKKIPSEITYKNNTTILFDFDDTLFDTSPTKQLRGAKTKDWEAIYAQIPNCKLYEGYDKVFEYINKNQLKIGVVSIAQKELIGRTIKHFNCPCHHIQGWWRMPMKPYPHQINKALEKLKANPKNVILFGDSPDDVTASKAAGIKVVGCTWGLSSQKEIDALIDSSPDGIINNPIEIIDILKNTHKLI